jgi:hypothetical protein
MKVKIDNLGVPHRSFPLLRDELISKKEKFSAKNLCYVPYEQLSLCAIAVAGTAACNLSLIREEKQTRRRRFLTLPSLLEVQNFLKIERMYEDLTLIRDLCFSPSWASLSYCQQAWAKLICIYNHIEAPKERLGAAIELLNKAQTQGTEITEKQHTKLVKQLSSLRTRFPATVLIDEFRDQILNSANFIGVCSEEVRKLARKEKIQDFQCVSDCFRV